MSDKRIHRSSPSSELFSENLEPINKRFKTTHEELDSSSNETSSSCIFNEKPSSEIVMASDSNGSSDLLENAKDDQKQVRYDRQLRLWGDHGQALLESAHVCLLNATALGTEILKSLVLPGVGSFTIIDGQLVTGADVGANFFLDYSSIGQSRGKVTCDLLNELNPDVKGNYLTVSSDQLVSEEKYALLDRFTVVIGTNLRWKTIVALGDYLYKRGIPFLICHSCGLVGYVRLVVKEHVVIESHPDNPLPNFMLDRPFPELLEFINSMDLNSMDHKRHSHTPYIVLMFKALEIWRREKGEDANRLPRTYKEKMELKKILGSMRKPDEKGSLDEENFQEAINSVNAALTETVVPGMIKQILDDDSAINLTKSSTNFWILCNALRRFVDEHGRLPVRGTVPDMISDSERFIALQNVYLRKFEEEADIVHSYAIEIAHEFEREIALAETRLFCKNAAFLRLIRYNSLTENRSDVHNENFRNRLLNGDDMITFWYLALRACADFMDEYDRYPCSLLDEDTGEIFEKDVQTILHLVKGFLGHTSDLNNDQLRKVINEVARYGGSEIHGVASYLGGIAAQEVIKLITHQYVPLNNTYVFDGNSGQSSVITF